MSTISHIMIGSLITAVFSVYTILNICTYVTDQQKYLITHYDKKIKSLTEQIDFLFAENAELVSKIDNISSTANSEYNNDNNIINNDNNECFELSDVYNEYNEVVEFTNEQLQLLLEVTNCEEENTNMGLEDQDADITLVNVNEEKDEVIVNHDGIQELVELDDPNDTKRVQDSLLVIARKALLGI